MNDAQIIRLLASVIAQSAPLMLAVTGETITERAGVINLSLDGTMLLAAMSGFVVALKSSEALATRGIDGDLLPVLIGFGSAALIGATAALLVAWGSIRLKQDQVAIGFVLTLLLADIANFLGQNYTRMPGPSVKHLPIPFLRDIPIIGPIFFEHDLLIYLTFVIVGFSWWWMYRTQPGLRMRGVGERPESAFVRGVKVNQIRYAYTAIGGALVGLAGAAYSLDIKLGWSDNHILGIGWIALAIVIFGGWRPVRGALGAVLYGVTKTLATQLQQSFPEVPVVLFNTLQWLLMLGVLLLVGSNAIKRLVDIAPKPLQRPLARALRVAPPQALGQAFLED
ncbi:MAG TPA: ABC transporter permease [Chloroflexi bacterium]|nr:ABC transporter permease [Chloroflexota bacterium]